MTYHGIPHTCNGQHIALVHCTVMMCVWGPRMHAPDADSLLPLPTSMPTDTTEGPVAEFAQMVPEVGAVQSFDLPAVDDVSTSAN